MDEMERARLEIDEADREMAALFEKRMEAAKTIAFYKKIPLLIAPKPGTNHIYYF